MFSRLSMNSLWLLIARFGTQIGLALFTVLLARQLGNRLFGEYAFMAAIVTVGNVVTTFGTDMYLIREIAASEDESSLSTALLLQLVLSVFFVGLVLFVSALLPGLPAEAVMAMRIYGFSMFPLAFFTVYTTSIRGRQRMLVYSLLNLALIGLQVASILLLIWLGGGLVRLALLLLLVQMLAAILAGRLAHVRLAPSPTSLTVASRSVRKLMTASASIAALAILGVMYQRLSLLVLPWLAGAAITGWFSAAARVVEAAKMGHLAVFTALYPMMAQARSKPSADFARTFRVPWWLLLGAASLAAIAISAFAAPLVGLLYGSSFAASVPLFRILAWCLVPYSITGFLTLLFLARGQTDCILRALIGATVALGTLTLWWLPLAGAPGAAFATLTAEVIQAIILALQYGRLGRVVPVAPESQYGLPMPS